MPAKVVIFISLEKYFKEMVRNKIMNKNQKINKIKNKR